MNSNHLLALAVLLLPRLVAGAESPRTSDNFCIDVQQFITASRVLPDSNTIHTDYQAFRESKTGVRPLTNHQYVMPEPGTANSPMRVSCKIKTPDHLNAEYGPGTATDQGLSCVDINLATSRRVYASLSAEEIARVRIPEQRIVFDPDQSTFMGSSWVGEFPFAYTGQDGRLHLQAKALRVDWDNVWLSWAPDRLRGALYCHLVAPEYLRRLVLGETTAGPLD